MIHEAIEVKKLTGAEGYEVGSYSSPARAEWGVFKDGELRARIFNAVGGPGFWSAESIDGTWSKTGLSDRQRAIEVATSMIGESLIHEQARLQIRPTVHRGSSGFTVSGKDEDIDHTIDLLVEGTVTIKDFLQAKLHETFTVAADRLAQAGALTKDERIEISSTIGDALKNFDAKFPQEPGAREIEVELSLESCDHEHEDFDSLIDALIDGEASIDEVVFRMESIVMKGCPKMKCEQIETVLWAVRVGDEDWQEELITSTADPKHLAAAVRWAKENGFDRLRVSSYSGEPPDFMKAVLGESLKLP